MSSFAKLFAVFAVSLWPTLLLAEKPADEKSQPAAKEPGEKKKNDKKKEKSVDPDSTDKAIDVPVPKGHDAKGLKIPYFDGDGKLQMTFTIGVASRLDDDHIQMSNLQIQTYDFLGEEEMKIDLPTSVMDLKTSVITTEQHVTIKRDDFELTGQTMEFNTKTRKGGLGGGVKMIIYDREAEFSEDPQPTKPKAK